MAPGKAPASPPCLADLLYGLVWSPLLTDTHFGVLLGEGCRAVRCCRVVQSRVWEKGHTKCSRELQKGASPLLFLACPAQRCIQLLALLSSGEREIHPNAPEVGCEETTALLLLLSPGMSFPLGIPRVTPGLRFALDAQGATSCVSCHRRSGLSWCVFAGGIPNELVKLSSHSLPCLLRETLEFMKKLSKKFAMHFSVSWLCVCPVVSVMLWQGGHGDCVCCSS